MTPSLELEILQMGRRNTLGLNSARRQSIPMFGYSYTTNGCGIGFIEFRRSLAAENVDIQQQPDLASAMQKVLNIFAEVPHRMSDPSLSNKALLIKHIVEEAVLMNEKILILSRSIPTLHYYEQMVKDMGISGKRIDGQSADAQVGRQKIVHEFNTNDMFTGTSGFVDSYEPDGLHQVVSVDGPM